MKKYSYFMITFVWAICWQITGCNPSNSSPKNLSSAASQLIDNLPARNALMFFNWVVDKNKSQQFNWPAMDDRRSEIQAACSPINPSNECLSLVGELKNQCIQSNLQLKRLRLSGQEDGDITELTRDLACQQLLYANLVNTGYILNSANPADAMGSETPAEGPWIKEVSYDNWGNTKIPTSTEEVDGPESNNTNSDSETTNVILLFENNDPTKPSGVTISDFFSIEITRIDTTTCSPNQIQILRAAIALLQKILPDPQFQKQMQDPNFWRHQDMYLGYSRGGKGLKDTTQIYDQIANSWVKNYIRCGGSGYGITAVGNPPSQENNKSQKKAITVGHLGQKYRSTLSVAMTIFHEAMHNIGFWHRNRPIGDSVPYRAADAIKYTAINRGFALVSDANIPQTVHRCNTHELALSTSSSQPLMLMDNPLEAENETNEPFTITDGVDPDAANNEEQNTLNTPPEEERASPYLTCHSEIGFFLTPDLFLHRTISDDICPQHRIGTFLTQTENYRGEKIHTRYQRLEQGNYIGTDVIEVSNGFFVEGRGWTLKRIIRANSGGSSRANAFLPVAFLPLAANAGTYSFNYFSTEEQPGDLLIDDGQTSPFLLKKSDTPSRLIPGTGNILGSLFYTPPQVKSGAGIMALGFNLSAKDRQQKHLLINAEYALEVIVKKLAFDAQQSHSRAQGVGEEIMQVQCRLWEKMDIPAVCGLPALAQKYCPNTVLRPATSDDPQFSCNMIKPCIKQPNILDRAVENCLANLEPTSADINPDFGKNTAQAAEAQLSSGCSIDDSDSQPPHNIAFLYILVFSALLIVAMKHKEKINRLWVAPLLFVLLPSCAADAERSTMPPPEESPQLKSSSLRAVTKTPDIPDPTPDLVAGTWQSLCLLSDNIDTGHHYTQQFEFLSQGPGSGSFTEIHQLFTDGECATLIKKERIVGTFTRSMNSVNEKMGSIVLTANAHYLTLYDLGYLAYFNNLEDSPCSLDEPYVLAEPAIIGGCPDYAQDFGASRILPYEMQGQQLTIEFPEALLVLIQLAEF